MIIDRFFRLFEHWIDPFATDDGPPVSAGPLAFVLRYVRQAKWPFVAMLFLGGSGLLGLWVVGRRQQNA